MWDSIKYVGTGLSLVAFVVAAILFAYRARLNQRAEIIRTAPETDRLEAIATTAEFFRVDVSALSRAQKQDIVLTQIRLRARRDLLLAGIALVVSISLAAVAMVGIIMPGNQGFTQDQTRMRLNLDQVRTEPYWIGIPAGVWSANRETWLSVLKGIDTAGDPVLKQYTDELISMISNAPGPTNVPGFNLGGDYNIRIPPETITKFHALKSYIEKKAIAAGLNPRT